MDIWHIEPWEIALRLVLALMLGGAIGWERERNSHAAGFRTNILVCLGSALIMVLSMYGFAGFAAEPSVRLDPARLAAQVLPALGFLGAGTILRNGLSVTGLTTSATLLVVAAIGLTAGAGFYFPAVLATVLVLLSLWVLNIVEKKFVRDKRVYSLKLTMHDRPGMLGTVSAALDRKGVDIRKLVVDQPNAVDTSNGEVVEVSLTLRFPKPQLVAAALDDLRSLRGVDRVSIE